MRFYKDMIDKYGFGDGDDEPMGVHNEREMYIRLINRLAEIRQCPIRAFAYDRPGMHNSCMILFQRVGILHDAFDAGVKQGQAIEFEEAMALGTLTSRHGSDHPFHANQAAILENACGADSDPVMTQIIADLEQFDVAKELVEEGAFGITARPDRMNFAVIALAAKIRARPAERAFERVRKAIGRRCPDQAIWRFVLASKPEIILQTSLAEIRRTAAAF